MRRFCSIGLGVIAALAVACTEDAALSAVSGQSFNCTGAQPSPAVVPSGVFGSIPSAVEFDLLSAPPSLVRFSRFDLKSGMSYSYGFAIEDFDCDAHADVSFFDSFMPERSALRQQPGAIGYLQWNGGALEEIYPSDTYQELPAAANGTVLFERHVTLDISGDKLPDIVGVINSHAAVAAYINPGVRNAPWQRRILSASTPGAVNITSGDVDGDGLPDLLVGLRRQPTTDPTPVVQGVVWLRNPGRVDQPWVQSHVEGSEDLADPRTLISADFDKDGRQDIMVSDNGGIGLAWFHRPVGGDTWVRQTINGITTAHGHYGITVDVDRDGFLDLLQPTYQGIAWVRNLGGSGAWQVTPLAWFARESRQLTVADVAVGDVDLDGRTDVLFAISSLSIVPAEARRGGIYWLRQQDAGWQLNEVLRTDNAVVGIGLLDYDVDGDLDFVANTEYQANAVTVWLNTLL